MDLLDIAMVPVPADHVAVFIELRDRLIAGDLDLDLDRPSEESEGGPILVVPGQGRWTEPMLRRLEDRLTYPRVRELLATCASRAGEWVGKSEVDASGGVGPYQLRNELSAFSKLTRKLFDEMIWPIEWMKTDEGYFYRMPTGVAEIWRQLRVDPADLSEVD